MIGFLLDQNTSPSAPFMRHGLDIKRLFHFLFKLFITKLLSHWYKCCSFCTNRNSNRSIFIFDNHLDCICDRLRRRSFIDSFCHNRNEVGYQIFIWRVLTCCLRIGNKTFFDKVCSKEPRLNRMDSHSKRQRLES